MPTWNQINAEIDAQNEQNACDLTRKKYLGELSSLRGRPAIAYYSGFLQKKLHDGRAHPEVAISDHDMNGFMAAVNGLPRDQGLDLILHTPGGDIEATRALVEYLYQMFGKDITVIVPQIAMSAGTMIACSAKEIIMGKQSCLGPTDPHFNGLPAMGILAEVDRAIQEIKQEPLKQIIWQQVFAKYPPAFILNCERAVAGARAMVKEWLKNNMLRSSVDPEHCSEQTITNLMDYDRTSGHNHHFLLNKCKAMGLTIVELENNQRLQDAVLSVHHSFMAAFTRTNAIKLVENNQGSSWIVGT